MHNKIIECIIFTYILQTVIIHSMVTASSLFSFGIANGDTVIIDSSTGFNSLSTGNIDDGIKIINIPNTPYFQKPRNTKLQLSTNGYVVFGNDRIFNSGSPTDFPISNMGYLVPLVAAFWSDFKFHVNSKFFYQIHSSGDVLKRVESIVLMRYPEEKLNPTHALIVTWVDVRHNGKADNELFTFQFVLASNGKTTHVIFLYDTLPHGVMATVGFQEGLNLYRYEYSMEYSVARQLLQSSNVDMIGVRVYRVAEEVIDCSDLPNGDNEHPSDCERFITCQLGVVQHMGQCNNSQHFDPNLNICVPAANFPCNQEKIQDCKGKGEGMFAHKSDCKKIVHCRFDKVVKVTSCPYGTVFNPNFKVCVFESQYKCIRGNTNSVKNFCDGKADGNYEDPKSCNHFIQCSNGLYHRTPCPAGLHFNQNGPPGTLGHCDWPFNVKCIR